MEKRANLRVTFFLMIPWYNAVALLPSVKFNDAVSIRAIHFCYHFLVGEFSAQRNI